MANRMKILVAYDGSECADAALDDLRRAGLPSDAQVKVLSVVENWLPPPSGLEIVTEIKDGHAKDVILNEAEKWGADLIVLGSHGYSGFERFLLGSVSHAVATHAHCSVEIVRQKPHAEK